MKHLLIPSLNLLILLVTSADVVAKKTIIEISDPALVTHKLKIQGITIGFSDKGGGYLNYLDMGDGINIVSTGYGRGWQGSVRDQLHRGRYNPTQAGFRDNAGVPVKLIVEDKKLIIPRFNVPLFGDPVFDFTEHEDLAPDYRRYPDNGNRDTDGIDEAERTQDDELRSEFDFEGVYEDASKLCDQKLPVLRFYSRYIYTRPPNAIRQFGKKARKKDGRAVLNENARLADISNRMPGKQTASDDDLSKVVFTPYGIRLKTKAGYNVPMWFSGGKWKSLKSEQIRGRGKEKVFLLAPTTQAKWKDTELLDSQLLVLAKADNPNKSPAIGFYSPQRSLMNQKPILGLDGKSENILYREDRRMRSVMMFSHVIPSQIGIRSRIFLTGLLAPEHGDPNAIEALQQESYILFGTPGEILECVVRTEGERLQN
jgi:hypothetical protein